MVLAVCEFHSQRRLPRKQPCREQARTGQEDRVPNRDGFNEPQSGHHQEGPEVLRQRRHQVGLVMVEGANRSNGEVRGLTVLGFDDQAGSIKGDVDLALQSGHPQARQHLAVTLHRAGERRLRHTHLGSLGASHYEDDPDGQGLKPGWERPRCSPNHARRSRRAEPMILGLESN